MMYRAFNITISYNLYLGCSKSFICDYFCERLESKSCEKTTVLKMQNETGNGLSVFVCVFMCDCPCEGVKKRVSLAG